MLGGTSSLNGMVYMRGTAADYDGWRQLGCVGWDYESVLTFFRKAENQERGEDEFHGVGGPLNVTDAHYKHEIIDAIIEAAVQAGIPRNRDFNGATQEGTGYYQEKSKPIQLLRKGDVVKILPDIEHWHGASPDSEFTHIAINTNTQKGVVVWLQRVTDKEYNRFK